MTAPTSTNSSTTPEAPAYEMTILAGGCFWCLQHPYDHLPGVISTVVGYTGGKTANPNYEIVSAGGSGHYEALKIIYDPQKISFKDILEVFWHNIDPFDAAGQFCDRGSQYRAAIFTLNADQKKVAQTSKDATTNLLGEKIVTEIIPAGVFYDGEDYHQKYYEKNPIRYSFYRSSCGRDRRLKEVWGSYK